MLIRETPSRWPIRSWSWMSCGSGPRKTSLSTLTESRQRRRSSLLRSAKKLGRRPLSDAKKVWMNYKDGSITTSRYRISVRFSVCPGSNSRSSLLPPTTTMKKYLLSWTGDQLFDYQDDQETRCATDGECIFGRLQGRFKEHRQQNT
ncbi:hypothetical protein BC939DRAFT_497668 [Gamsiella multidivaricata]|uniref:uncharacterized protein n=1 Tax=Gamsiella multidivaricata TaxID=101098 RepID=UPI00221FED88|nr:uncharacterized protein BC939DRAFT_497668 [Gamsiella multidivaricata]KAI7816078.1 hypothetical protein BC939DRAFT_497668 [Gamsiella multidivaricata]